MTAENEPVTPGQTGSPVSGEPVYLSVGRLRRPHGLRGEILMEIYTDFPQRLRAGTRLYIGDAHIPMTIAALRGHNNGLLITFRDVKSPDEAGKYRNTLVFVRADDRPPLPDGEFYHHEVIGLKVVNESDEELGILAEILITGANEVYVVKRSDGRELLLPAIEDVILSIDPVAGVIRARLLPGLE